MLLFFFWNGHGCGHVVVCLLNGGEPRNRGTEPEPAVSVRFGSVPVHILEIRKTEPIIYCAVRFRFLIFFYPEPKIPTPSQKYEGHPLTVCSNWPQKFGVKIQSLIF